MPPRAVLLDLDGTLVDSRAGIRDAFAAALRAEGLPPVPPEAVDGVVGAPLAECFDLLTGRPDLAERLCARYRARYDVVCATGCTLMPGVAATLPVLAAKARLAVVTTKLGRYPRTMLEAHGVAGFFDAWVGADDAPRPKPAPDPVLEACRRLGVAPAEAAMVGDTRFDVGAAKAAGALAVGVLGGHGGRAELEAAGADLVVRRFDELPAALHI